MLFKVESGKDVFVLNPELKAVEEFVRLTPRQMNYVALFADYGSPFRKLPTYDRKVKAAVESGYKYEKSGKRLDTNGRNLVDGKVGSVEAAVKKYKDIQFDEDWEALISINDLIADVRDLNRKPDKSAAEIEKAVKVSKDLPALIKTKKEIEEIIGMREEAPIEQETEDSDSPTYLSLLDEVNAGTVKI